MRILKSRQNVFSTEKLLLQLSFMICALSVTAMAQAEKEPAYTVTIEGATFTAASETSGILPGADETSIVRVGPLSALTSALIDSGKINSINRTTTLSKIGDPVRISLQPGGNGARRKAKKLEETSRELTARIGVDVQENQILYFAIITVDAYAYNEVSQRNERRTVAQFSFKLGENDAAVMKLPGLLNRAAGASPDLPPQQEYLIIRIKEAQIQPEKIA